MFARRTTVFLFLYYTACASAAALPASTNSTSYGIAERQIMHVGDEVDLWCNRVLFKDYASDSCDGITYYTGRKPLVVTKTTNIKDKNRGDSILATGHPIDIRTPVCDFILPPSFVLERLRKSKACQKAAADQATGRRTITGVFSKLDHWKNQRLLQRERLKDYKAALVGTGLISTSITQPSRLEQFQIMSYILRSQEKTLAIAKAIDGDIWTKYHVHTRIEVDWNARLKKIFAKWKRLREDIRHEIQCLGGNSPPDSGSPMDTSQRRKRNDKLQARFLSILDSAGEGLSALPLSALERRVGPARSGPKAAKCPTCPKKNQPPKKTVPRSKVQPKPKPAVKPRKPASAPQPRKPSPTKKVTPRPATRSRRVPGKSEPPKRATPKVKPRVVPKPTRKPRGKPRTRRRR